jgi:hypothetical protein
VPEDPAYTKFISKLNEYASLGYTTNVKYTPDSVRNNGVLLEPYTDTLNLEAGFIIVSDLDAGVKIYDDPSTEIIDGIRVNGNTITSYKVPIDLDNPQHYIVNVKLDYADGILGSLAKISDGKFDWEVLMEEPVLLIQAGYYLIAAISLIVGGLGVATSKRKKVKTADEIACKVDERVHEGCETFAVAYSDVLKENLLPIFHEMVATNQAVIKAITLSTSKNKEAPVALLDVLKQVSDVDVEKAIDEAREDVLRNIALTDAKRAAIHNVLTHIADGTYQEVHNVAESKQPQTKLSQTTKDTSQNDETQSLF